MMLSGVKEKIIMFDPEEEEDEELEDDRDDAVDDTEDDFPELEEAPGENNRYNFY